ncbi:MAG: GNAT family N-acetyltransferase [Actinobacteria bacterium]|nr:GNAT family N-acetyltransferase [Actinomycetota bacterium]
MPEDHPAAEGDLPVEPASADDAPQVARLHAAAISEGFLSTLGPRFLTLLYRSMAGSERAVLLVAREGEAVRGFVAGAVAPGAFYREFLRRHAPAAAVLLAGRALRPRVARRILETLRHLGREGGGGPELLSIAVAPLARRTGLASRLVRELEDELGTRGAERLAVVVGTDNQPARSLYEAVGFELAGDVEVHAGRPSVRYAKPLSP